MNSFLRREWQWPRKMSTCLNTPKWQRRMCPIFMSWRPCSLPNHKAMWRSSFPGDISTGTLPMRVSSISMTTSPCPEIVPATLCCSHTETGRWWPKGLDLQDPCKERLTGTYRWSAVCPGAYKNAEAGSGSATEFQFRDGFGHGCGQPPQ